LPLLTMSIMYFSNENFKDNANKVLSALPGNLGNHFQSVPTKDEREKLKKDIAKHYVGLDPNRIVDKLLIVKGEDTQLFNDLIILMSRENPNKMKNVKEDLRLLNLKNDPINRILSEIDKDSEEKINRVNKISEGASSGNEITEEILSRAEEVKEVSTTVNMMVPVVGQIVLPFADDRLVYHKTLDQWSTHKGIDIKASEGTPVKAALDGEVVEVISDTIEGIVITLKHDNDLYTRYGNLSTDAMVNVGDRVVKGQTISGVGKTASNKSLEGPLLHFQVLNDDKFVNPQTYLGK